MGNRAVITTEEYLKDENTLGIYVHWNGGRDSVEAFLTYCKLKQYRTPEDDCYGWARLCQTICNFFRTDCLPEWINAAVWTVIIMTTGFI
jgi:hypothetical protein